MAVLEAVALYAAACLFFSGAMGQKVLLMENFDPAKTEGTWYLIQRTGSLYNDSLGCATYKVKHKDGVVYEVELDYLSKSNTMMKKIFRIIDDSDHPAQFFFADQDNKKVAVSFLGTDYKNWNVAYGYIHGGVPAYGISSRTPTLDPKYFGEANEILKRNEIYGSMQDCPPRQ